MKCSKLPFAFRPLLETLESRLQPGSLITGPGYGWSLLADSLSFMDQPSLDSRALVSQPSLAGSQPAPASSSGSLLINLGADAHSENLTITVAEVAAARSSSLPANSLVDNLANNLINNLVADLTNDNLTNLSVARQLRTMEFAAAASSPILQPGPATPMGSVAQSPIGVANPAQPASPALPANPGAPVSSGVSLQRGGPVSAVSLNAPTVHHIAIPHSTNALRAVPITVATTLPMPGGEAGNQAAVNFLSYLGGSSGTGPDSINNVVVRTEGGTNFMYVVGSITDSTGRTDAFAAKLAGDGSSVKWITSIPATTPGPDNATGLALNGNNVYVSGSLADPASTPQTDGFIVQLDTTSGTMGGQFMAPNATFAALATDSSGNVDIGGSVANPNNAGEVDIFLLQISSDLTTQNPNYGGFVPLTLSGNSGATNSSVTNGGGLVLDSQGNAYFAATVGVIGDPNNETFATYGRLSADGTSIDWGIFFHNVTPGPGGVGTAVALDPNGNIVFTGSMNDNGSSTAQGDPTGNPTPLNQDLMLGRFVAAPQATAQQQVLDFSPWFVDDRSGSQTARAGDWTANGLAVLADGSAIVTGAAYDPNAGTGVGDPKSVPTKGIDVEVTHFTPDDMHTTQNNDGDPENIFGGSGTDIANAVAVDPNSSSSPFNVFVVGSTTSTDLPTTSGVIGQTYSGTNATGFVGQVSIA